MLELNNSNKIQAVYDRVFGILWSFNQNQKDELHISRGRCDMDITRPTTDPPAKR